MATRFAVEDNVIPSGMGQLINLQDHRRRRASRTSPAIAQLCGRQVRMMAAEVLWDNRCALRRRGGFYVEAGTCPEWFLLVLDLLAQRAGWVVQGAAGRWTIRRTRA